MLRLGLRADSLDHIRAPPRRASFVPGRNLKKGETTRSTGGPRQPGLWSPAEEEEKEDDDDDEDEDGGAGGRDRRPSFARPAGAAILALGPASRLPEGSRPRRAPSLRLLPLLRPELSHRCPATILGWPQTRTRIAFGQSVAKPPSSGPRSPACGVPLGSLKAPGQISGAARPTTSQTLSGSGPSRGKVDEQARGSRPCVGIPIAPGVCLLRSRPGVPRVARVGSQRRPESGGNLLCQARGTPTPLSPPPAWAPPARRECRKQGPEAGSRFQARGAGCWTRGVPAPAQPRARTGSGALRFPVAESRPGRRRWRWRRWPGRRGALECAAGSPAGPGEPGWEPAGWRGAGLNPSGRLWRLGAGAGF